MESSLEGCPLPPTPLSTAGCRPGVSFMLSHLFHPYPKRPEEVGQEVTLRCWLGWCLAASNGSPDGRQSLMGWEEEGRTDWLCLLPASGRILPECPGQAQ